MLAISQWFSSERVCLCGAYVCVLCAVCVCVCVWCIYVWVEGVVVCMHVMRMCMCVLLINHSNGNCRKAAMLCWLFRLWTNILTTGVSSSQNGCLGLCTRHVCSCLVVVLLVWQGQEFWVTSCKLRVCGINGDFRKGNKTRDQIKKFFLFTTIL